MSEEPAVSIFQDRRWRCGQRFPLKSWYSHTRQHGVMIHMYTIWTVTAVKTKQIKGRWPVTRNITRPSPWIGCSVTEERSCNKCLMPQRHPEYCDVLRHWRHTLRIITSFIYNLTLQSVIPLCHIYTAYNLTHQYFVLDVHTYTSCCRRIHVETSRNTS
jgi:hypothetical protein